MSDSGIFHWHINGEQPSRPRRYSDIVAERNERIRADYLAGLMINEIAARHSLSYTSVHKITADLPRRPRAPDPRTDVVRNEQIITEYNSGVPVTVLGDKHNITRGRVCQILRPGNHISRLQERRRLAREELQNAADQARAEVKAKRERQIAEAIELVRQGLSIRQAAKQVTGVAHSLFANLVGSRCKQLGIQVQFGRHRSFEREKQRARELREAGHSWASVQQIMCSEGLRFFPSRVPKWFPDLVRSKPQKPMPPVQIEPIPQKPGNPLKEEHAWTEAEVAQLKSDYLAGLSMRQIAERLGPQFNRNMVIGKINRLRTRGDLRLAGTQEVTS